MDKKERSQRELWNSFVKALMEAEAAWDNFRSNVQVDLLLINDFPIDAQRVIASGLHRSKFQQIIDRLLGYLGHKPLWSLCAEIPKEEKDEKPSSSSTGGGHTTRRR